MAPKPVWIAAVLFYILYAIGVSYFIVAPAVAGSLTWYAVLLRAAFFGLIAYGTYDLTNQATVINWSMAVTVVDMLWGAGMTGVASLIAFLILK